MNAKGRQLTGPSNRTDTGSVTTRKAGEARIDALADDIGRLRRRLDSESYDGFLIGRISGHVESLDAMMCATAAELCAAGFSMNEALGVVDERDARLRSRLGETR